MSSVDPHSTAWSPAVNGMESASGVWITPFQRGSGDGFAVVGRDADVGSDPIASISALLLSIGGSFVHSLVVTGGLAARGDVRIIGPQHKLETPTLRAGQLEQDRARP